MQKPQIDIKALEKYYPATISNLAILCIMCFGILKSFEAVSIEGQSIGNFGQTQSSYAYLDSKPSKAEMAETLWLKGDTSGAYKLLREEWDRTGKLASVDPQYKHQFTQTQLKMINLIFDQAGYLDAIKYTQTFLEAEEKERDIAPDAVPRDFNNLGLALQFEGNTISRAYATRRAEYLNLAVHYYEIAADLYAKTGKYRFSEVITKLNEYQALKDLGKDEAARKVLKEARALNIGVGFNLSPPMYFD